jgi:hypothetical protein
MFFFGEPEDQAKLYWSGATAKTGPQLADRPLDEMSNDELKIALTYARMACEAAQRDGAPDPTLAILLEQHDAVFEALAQSDEVFRDRVLGKGPGRVIWLGGYSPENIAKYQGFASAN